MLTSLAGSISDRQSTSNFIVSLKSGAISWSSKMQPIVALSSTKVEYRGASIAICEAIWLNWLLNDFNESVDEPIHIYCDNQSSV
mgnify:CR=1 FL=1